MRTFIWLIHLGISFNCLCQGELTEHPYIRLGDITDSIVDREDLLRNKGIIFSNDTSRNLLCLKAIDFTFRIVKLNYQEIIIGSNTCPDMSKWSQKKIDRYDDKMLSRISKGKNVKCSGANKFNKKQLKAILKMRSGDTLFIDIVTTSASSCSCLNRKWRAGLKYTIR